jgi:hypothetical protein
MSEHPSKVLHNLNVNIKEKTKPPGDRTFPLTPFPSPVQGNRLYASTRKFFSEKSADFSKIGTKRAPFGPIYRCTRFSIHFLAPPSPAPATQPGKKKTHRRIPQQFGHFRTFPTTSLDNARIARQFNTLSRRGAEAQREPRLNFPPSPRLSASARTLHFTFQGLSKENRWPKNRFQLASLFVFLGALGVLAVKNLITARFAQDAKSAKKIRADAVQSPNVG